MNAALFSQSDLFVHCCCYILQLAATNFYGSPQQITHGGETRVSVQDVVPEETKAEWNIFCRMSSSFSNSEVLTSKETMNAISLVLPVTTGTVERSFSDMKLVKTRLRNRLGEDTLDQAMH